jgi:hypothetical protein
MSLIYDLIVKFGIKYLGRCEVVFQVEALATFSAVKVFLRYPIYWVLQAVSMTNFETAMVANK